ncbi:NAD-dependent epimerase/dehydratase family protein [Echinicola salinicaeni]|uniref:NAD-dependent epimerase/dehydratase family protein n=1 Tax=Echinicola salinicaeni TaxID=2762757 RepID=UPI001648D426|nr:NAD-dependent epimerase/dehydratase family protein [Echinicola salinicaeni]
MKIKAIITGSTGMVGKAVLLECLENEKVGIVLIINRHPVGVQHPKLIEIILENFEELPSVKDDLKGYNACYHCLGISALGMNEKNYYKITYNITKELADILYEHNSNLIFNYVSGVGTDSSEKGKIMWARVKGKTENMILNKGFKDAYSFRPGFIVPEKGVKSRTKLYNLLYLLFKPSFPVLKKSSSITTTTKIGKAMINVSLFPMNKKILTNKDINALAK